NFFRDWIRTHQAGKRGDGVPDDSVERLREEGVEFPADDAQLQRAVDLGFARLVHQRVMSTLEQKAADPKRFAALRDFIPFEHGSDTYEKAAKQLGLSAAVLRKAVFDQRKRYVQL